MMGYEIAQEDLHHVIVRRLFSYPVLYPQAKLEEDYQTTQVLLEVKEAELEEMTGEIEDRVEPPPPLPSLSSPMQCSCQALKKQVRHTKMDKYQNFYKMSLLIIHEKGGVWSELNKIIPYSMMDCC